MKMQELAPSRFDFHSPNNELILNPKLIESEQIFFSKAWDFASKEVSGHFALATSGTTSAHGRGKLVLLGKSSILASARAVNRHLSVSANDIWLKALPDFHVGGLGILARAELSGSRVFEYQDQKWSPQNFYSALNTSHASIISLVPTQLYDLLKYKLRAPPSLRAALIGGAALSAQLFSRAKELNWNVLPSYGMTETCSMIACANPELSEFSFPKTLSHAQVKLNPLGQIEVSCDSLLTAYVLQKENGFEILDPKICDDQKKLWFCPGDFAEISSKGIEILGRESEFVKIGGEGVSLLKLESLLKEIILERSDFCNDYALLAAPDERLGFRINLLSTAQGSNETAMLVELFNKRLMGIEKVRQVHFVELIPRTALGKLKRLEALELIAKG